MKGTKRSKPYSSRPVSSYFRSASQNVNSYRETQDLSIGISFYLVSLNFTGCNDNGGKSILGNEDYQDKFKEHDE
jgi:hypothetical protein